MLDYICTANWTPYGIQCGDPLIAKKVHRFMRQAILDRHVYINKIIGFTIKTNNTFRAGTGDYITRHEQIGESYPELMISLQDKIFLDTNAKELDVDLETGMNNVDNSIFRDVATGKTATVLYENCNICRCLKKSTILRVEIQYDCGFRAMPENCNYLDNSYFPCYTDYSLAPFYRVLPMEPGATLVPIRYCNKATEGQLKDILNTWSVYIKSGSVKMEEKEWLQSFGRL